MLTRQSFRILVVILGFVISSAASARAGAIYTSAGVDGTWSPGTSPPSNGGDLSDYWNRGGVSTSASDARGLASGYASINLLGPDPGFHFLVGAGSDTSLSTSVVYTKAQWIDVIRLSGTTPPPAQLQLHVRVEGAVDLSHPPGGLPEASTRFGVEVEDGNSLISGSPGSSGQGFSFQSEVLISVGAPPFQGYFLNSNTQNLSHDPFDPSAIAYRSPISWDTTFNLPYHPEVGGYTMSLVAGVRGVGFHLGNSSIDLLNTIRLTDVTLTNGDPVPGEITFDSGFTLPAVSAVPEPSSLVMSFIGGFGCLGYAWRHRRLVKFGICAH